MVGSIIRYNSIFSLVSRFSECLSRFFGEADVDMLKSSELLSVARYPEGLSAGLVTYCLFKAFCVSYHFSKIFEIKSLFS